MFRPYPKKNITIHLYDSLIEPRFCENRLFFWYIPFMGTHLDPHEVTWHGYEEKIKKQ
jgi:hypothetical protein